ncbi:hypothetical protein [Alicyclobacillus sp. ALC3]|uniref:hypothetical protein n=1 Tax=Alicyclobacillus sp. ALC3 TaxID=2796143 RepID=UPI0023796307|nr:hypothetical protein [Alicyclobacillus sp. ALC3]WDL99749.1 hypothetical protein JC200_23535 [Alicyclobacillus sp. ALC3]
MSEIDSLIALGTATVTLLTALVQFATARQKKQPRRNRGEKTPKSGLATNRKPRS